MFDIDFREHELIQRLNSLYNSLFDAIKKPSRYFAVVLLLVIIMLLVYGIATREIAALRDFGVSELALVLSIWIIFIELPNITRDGEHIQVDYFYTNAAPRTRYYMDLLRYGICVFGAIVLFVSSLLVTSRFLVGTTPIIGLPRYVYSIPFVFAFTFLLLIYFRGLVRTLVSDPEEYAGQEIKEYDV